MLFPSNVDEGDHTLSLDVINEDQERPGLIGSGQVPLGKVFETGRFEDCVPIVAPTGATLGYIFTRLNFTVSASICKYHEMCGPE